MPLNKQLLPKQAVAIGRRKRMRGGGIGIQPIPISPPDQLKKKRTKRVARKLLEKL